MNIKKSLADFVAVFAVTFLVSVIVTWLWNLSVHGASSIDWETSFRLAIIFGVLLTWMKRWQSKAT